MIDALYERRIIDANRHASLRHELLSDFFGPDYSDLPFMPRDPSGE